MLWSCFSPTESKIYAIHLFPKYDIASSGFCLEKMFVCLSAALNDCIHDYALHVIKQKFYTLLKVPGSIETHHCTTGQEYK